MLFANWKGEGLGIYSVRRLKAYAEGLGLDMQAFNSCLASNRPGAAVNADMATAVPLGISGTPSLFINGTKVNDPTNFGEVSNLINIALGTQ